MYDLGSRLKYIRHKRGLTQKKLAAKVNKSVSAISSYESNAQLPPLDVLESIALTLHVSIDYLAGIETNYTYSTCNLSPPQIEILDMLYEEFASNSSAQERLTEKQIQILQKLIFLFYNMSV